MSRPNSRAICIVAVWILFGASRCFPLNTESVGKDCQNGQPKACAELARIATSAKHPKDRIEAIQFISDSSLLSSIANGTSLDQSVSQAAANQLAFIKRQAQAREEEQESIMPNAQEIQRQVALLNSYKAGVTTLDDFYADKWNARDPFLTKLGIVQHHFYKPNQTYEFEIAYYDSYDHRIDAKFALQFADFTQRAFDIEFESTVEGGSLGDLVSCLPFSDPNGISPCVVVRYPIYLLKFVGGRLASIEKK